MFVCVLLKINGPSKGWPSALSRSSFCCCHKWMLSFWHNRDPQWEKGEIGTSRQVEGLIHLFRCFMGGGGIISGGEIWDGMWKWCVLYVSGKHVTYSIMVTFQSVNVRCLFTIYEVYLLLFFVCYILPVCDLNRTLAPLQTMITMARPLF